MERCSVGPGVTTGGTGSQTSVSFGLGFAGVWRGARRRWLAGACGAAVCCAATGSVSRLTVVTIRMMESVVRMGLTCRSARRQPDRMPDIMKTLGFWTAAERPVKRRRTCATEDATGWKSDCARWWNESGDTTT